MAKKSPKANAVITAEDSKKQNDEIKRIEAVDNLIIQRATKVSEVLDCLMSIPHEEREVVLETTIKFLNLTHMFRKEGY